MSKTPEGEWGDVLKKLGVSIDKGAGYVMATFGEGEPPAVAIRSGGADPDTLMKLSALLVTTVWKTIKEIHPDSVVGLSEKAFLTMVSECAEEYMTDYPHDVEEVIDLGRRT